MGQHGRAEASAHVYLPKDAGLTTQRELDCPEESSRVNTQGCIVNNSNSKEGSLRSIRRRRALRNPSLPAETFWVVLCHHGRPLSAREPAATAYCCKQHYPRNSTRSYVSQLHGQNRRPQSTRSIRPRGHSFAKPECSRDHEGVLPRHHISIPSVQVAVQWLCIRVE